MNIDKPYNLTITDHALMRYRQRADYKGVDLDAAHLIRTSISKAKEWRLKPEHRVRQLLTHDCQPARYFKRKSLMYVIAGREVITVHNGVAERFEPMV